MNIMLIQTFLSVANNQSITKAANELFLSQSTVSARLQQLENELGVTLVERHKGIRNVELTARGQAFLPIAQRYQQLDQEITFFPNEEYNYSLTLACPDSLNIHMFLPLYQQLLHTSPRINLTVRTQQSPEIYTLIDQYQADIGFVFHQYRYGNVVTELAFREKMVLLVSSHSDWPEKPIHPSQLDKRYELYFRWSDRIVLWHDSYWNLTIPPYAQVDTVTLLAGLFDDPRCWALCPISVARVLQENENISIRLCAVDIPDRDCYMLIRSDRIHNDEISIFRKHFLQYIRTLDYFSWKQSSIE